MSNDIYYTIVLAIAFLLLFGSAELLYFKAKIKAEYTRKYVHFFTGLITLLFPVLVGNHWLVLTLCSSFAILLIISLKFNFLKSINAIDRISLGSVLYPIVVYIIYFIYTFYQSYVFFYVPIIIMAACDPAAALVGNKFPFGKFKIRHETKTIAGSGAFFLMAILISIILLTMLTNLSGLNILYLAILISFLTAITEAVCQKGYDNLAIPFTCIILLIVFDYIVTIN